MDKSFKSLPTDSFAEVDICCFADVVVLEPSPNGEISDAHYGLAHHHRGPLKVWAFSTTSSGLGFLKSKETSGSAEDVGALEAKGIALS
jgi:hypothetical protein